MSNTWTLKHWYWCEACGWMDRQTSHKEAPAKCPSCGKAPTLTPTDISGLSIKGSLVVATAVQFAAETTTIRFAAALCE